MEDFKKHTTEMQSCVYEKGGLLPFLITYHLSIKKIARIMNQGLNILYMNEEVKSVFTLVSMISFRSARKLSSNFRAKLYPLEKVFGLF